MLLQNYHLASIWALPVLWGIGQWDHNVLVDEDEECQEEAESHGADHIHGWQTLKWSHVEDGPVVDFKHRNWWEAEEEDSQFLMMKRFNGGTTASANPSEQLQHF